MNTLTPSIVITAVLIAAMGVLVSAGLIANEWAFYAVGVLTGGSGVVAFQSKRRVPSQTVDEPVIGDDT